MYYNKFTLKYKNTEVTSGFARKVQMRFYLLVVHLITNWNVVTCKFLVKYMLGGGECEGVLSAHCSEALKTLSLPPINMSILFVIY